MRDAEVAVVGGGIVGLAAAWALAARGRRTVLLERFRVGHPHGSSHGTSRIFRLSHAERAKVEDAREALLAWRALEERSKAPLLALTGVLDCGRDLAPLAHALEAATVPFEVLEAAAVEDRLGVRLPPGETGLVHREGGIVRADAALAALRAVAGADGAEIREETRVTAIEPARDAVALHTPAGPLRARAAIVAAGPWARGLLAPLGIAPPTRETRETVVYVERTARAALPSVIDWAVPGAGDAIYALEAPGAGVKVGVHGAGALADPDAPGAPDPHVLETALAWVRERLPGADAETPLRAETCFYTSTPDHAFVLDRHDRVVVGSACSGQGFKFAPLTGARLAALAEEAL